MHSLVLYEEKKGEVRTVVPRTNKYDRTCNAYVRTYPNGKITPKVRNSIRERIPKKWLIIQAFGGYKHVVTICRQQSRYDILV